MNQSDANFFQPSGPAIMLLRDVKHMKLSLLHKASRIQYLKSVLTQLGKNGYGYYVDFAIRCELIEIFNCLRGDLSSSLEVDESIKILRVRPSLMPFIKMQYRKLMIAGLDELLQRWDGVINCVKIVLDKEVFYAVTYDSCVKEYVSTKLTDIGITYCVVNKFSQTLKLQGTISQNSFNDFMKGLIFEMFGFNMINVNAVFAYIGDCDMPVGRVIYE